MSAPSHGRCPPLDPVEAIKQTIATDVFRSVEQRRHWYSPAAAAYPATRPHYPQQLVDAVVGTALERRMVSSDSRCLDLVNQAAAQQSALITVPQSTYTLNYGSVEAVGSQGASFFYSVDGGTQLFGAANCQAGLVHGQPPASAAEAQLLNTVCQVAYGAPA